MVLFVNTLIILFTILIFWVANLLSGGLVLEHVLGWFSLSIFSPWWQLLIFYFGLDSLTFFVTLPFVNFFIRGAYERRQGRLFEFLHYRLNLVIHCKGQRWPAFFLIPASIFHILAVVLVWQGKLTPATWCTLSVGMMGLWGNYLVGEPGSRKKIIPLPPQREPSKPSPLPLTPLNTAQFIEHLRKQPWYLGQITYAHIPPVSQPPPSAPFRVRRAFNMLDKLGETRTAQYASTEQQNIIASDSMLSEMFKNLVGSQSPRLYTHQGAVLNLLEPGNRMTEERKPAHVILATPLGSGQSVTILLAALRRVLRDHEGVLVIFPDRYSGQPQVKRLRESLAATPWGWAVTIQEWWPTDDPTIPIDWQSGHLCPDILFTSLDFIHQYLLTDHVAWQFFFQSVGLTILEGLDAYEGTLGLNAVQVFSRLNRVLKHNGTNPQILAVASNAQDVNQRFASLLKADEPPAGRVITDDGSGRKSKALLFWNPPLDREPVPNPALTRQEVYRKDYYDQIRHLVAELIRSGYQPVVLSQSANITDADVAQFNNSIMAELADDLRNNSVTQYDVLIGESFHLLTNREGKTFRDDPRRFNACVVAGVPASWASLRHEIEHLGEAAARDCDTPLVIIVAPDTPLAQSIVRDPVEFLAESFTIDRRTSLLDSANQLLFEKHILYAANELPLRRLEFLSGDIADQDETSDVFGEAGEKALRQLIFKGFLQEDVAESWDLDHQQPVKVHEYRMSTDQILPRTDLLTVGRDIWQISPKERPDTVIAYKDEHSVYESAFRHSILNLQGCRYRVVELIPEQKQVMVVPEGHPRYTERIAEITTRCMSHDSHDTGKFQLWLSENRQMPISLRLADIEVNIKVTGFRQFESLALDISQMELFDTGNDPATQSRNIHRPTETKFETRGLFLGFTDQTSVDVIHTLAHLFHIVLPFYVRNPAEEIGIYELEKCSELAGLNGLVIYDNIPGGVGIVDWLETNLTVVLEKAFELLVECPCASGCRSCLKVPDCHKVEANSQLDKKETIRLLGRLLGKNTEIILRHRYEACDSLEAMEIRRWQIVEQVFPHRLGLRIHEPAELRLAHQKPKTPTLVDGIPISENNIIIVQPKIEEQVIGILAHEYAHQWEYHGTPFKMSPTLMDKERVPFFDGKLFIEGFAQWIEFKVADHFSFRQPTDQVAFQHFGQYREGFEALKWLEDHPAGGVERVLEFVREGQVAIGNDIITPESLVQVSGVLRRLRDAEARFRENTPGIDIREKEEEEEPEAGDVDNPDLVNKCFQWRFQPRGSRKEVEQKLEVSISRSRFEQYHRQQRSSNPLNCYAEQEMPEIRDLALKFLKLHARQNWNTFNQAYNVLKFVQSCIPYSYDKDSTGHEEWPRYPIETLMEETGDCEDVAILCCAIIARLGFHVVLLRYPGHVAFGVAGAEKLKGDYVLDPKTGLRYFYGEATSQGWHLGEIPKDRLGHEPKEILPVNILIQEE